MGKKKGKEIEKRNRKLKESEEERNRKLKESEEERNRELKESEEINRKLKESEEGGTSGHIQNTSASSRDGDGLYEGLDWLSNNIASKDFSEVRIDSDHMEYLWAPATFIRENDNGTLQMKFVTEQNNFNKKTSLRTYNSLGGSTEDISIFRIRPSPPNFGLRSYCINEKVEVLVMSGWCPGIITNIYLGRKYCVRLGRDNKTEYFDYWQIRPCMEWKDRSWHTKSSEKIVISGLEKMELSSEKLFSRLFGKEEMRILMMGPDAVGKTMILDTLKHGENGMTTTTTAIINCNVETVEHKNISFSMWDVWGENKRHYLHRTHGLIFVVDCNDSGSFVKAKDELHLMMNKVELRDAVLLVFANNPAPPNTMNTNEIAGTLELHSLQQGWKIQNTFASSRDGDGLYEGLDWLSKNIAYKDFSEVRIDSDHMEYLWAPAMFIRENDNGTLQMKFVTERNNFNKKTSLRTYSSLGGSTEDISIFRIRPSPPSFGVRSYCINEKVEVLLMSGWCPGVITNISLGRKYCVCLGRDNKNEYFDYWQIRPHMEWKDRSWQTVEEKGLDSEQNLYAVEGEVEELIKLLFFGFLFSREDERAWCASDIILDNSSYDYLVLLSELKSISRLSQLLYQSFVANKKVAFEVCIKHAKLWLANSDQLVNYSDCRVSYASLKNILKNIMESSYFIHAENTILKYTVDFSRAKIIVFWDFENAYIPKGQDPSKIFENIISALRKLNLNGDVEMVGIGNMKKIKKYEHILRASGITFMDVPGGKKNAADGKIIVEMLVWAFQHEMHHAPGSILLIAGDMDYFSVIEKLRSKGFNMLVAHHQDSNKKLSQPANSDWLWTDLSKGDISEELIQKLIQHVSH